MFSLRLVGIVLGVVVCCNCQYNGGGESSNSVYRERDQSEYNNYQNTPPPPQILSHKQALNHDGNFKYLFTSENGLAQGESIAPDGSRNGGYSYTDPNGRKITVKYTAGKEGFRILQADHLPKAPEPIVPGPEHQSQPAPQPYRPQYYNTPQQRQQQDDGQYKPELYERQDRQEPESRYRSVIPAYLAAVRQEQRQEQPQQQAQYHAPLVARPAPSSNALEDKEPEYHDEPGKPHSFGTGYIFEFSG